MKKIFKLDGLECANCAAKMEKGISKMPGVNACTISFMTQKMTLDAEDAKFDEIVEVAQKYCRKFERHVTIVR